MKSKRGVSDILLAILFILLILVAITILLLSIKPTIEEAGEEAQRTSSCLTIDMGVLECIYTSESDAFGGRLSGLTVKRGSGNSVLSDIRFVFEDSTGNRVIKNTSQAEFYNFNLPDELESSFGVFRIGYFEPKDARTAAVLSEGKKVCDSYNLPKTCKLNEFGGCLGDVDQNGMFDTRDVLAFLDIWISAINSGNYDSNADFNKDLIIDSRDVLDATTAFTDNGC